MTSFNDLGLDPKVLKAVAETGYTTPTPIQAEAIPHALQGKDVLGIAQTGTGKTASFTLPMITMLAKGRARARMPRSLVLCPTRELAAQVAENFETYAKHAKLSMALLIGGVSFKDQDRLIDRGVDVLIATPGRLLDHFERGKLMLNGVQIMVVDEADRMLDMGFIPDIERIFKLTPFTRQTLFFSATMAPEITRITQEFLHNPVRVEVARQATTSETITQAICMHTPSRKDQGPKDKRDILRTLIESDGEGVTNAIIFCNRKRDVDIVAKSLKKHGLDAAALHGDLDQSLRMKILNSFRDGELKLLVASDVAARGLDIPNVSHVFNFDVPIHSEDYVHRIGRTGRAGRKGKAITICLPFEEKYLANIEALVKQEIPRMDSPLKTETTAPKAEEKPARQSRPKKVTEKPKVVETVEKPVEAPKSEEPKVEAPKPASRDNNKRSDNNRRPQRGRGRGRDNGPSVIGMGDHVPAFMLRDLRALQAAATPKEVAEETPEVIEDQVESAEVVVVETPVEEAPKKPRRRRAPRKKADEAVQTDEPKAEETVAEDAAEEKPAKKPRKRRVTKKKEEPSTEETPVDETKAE
ncbi:MAG: DEAD/DEAH box helicase [Rhodobacteraceae bacterium]|nr:MAG: DEAD/DEAH box helicase [Paracoccaceae bacterium]